jgi:type IX secretion system PorP/SprF family membrane protein
MLKQFISTFLLLVIFISADAQDPQFSQFYAAPVYLNPAFAGSNQATRAVFNYRNQWPGIPDANFISYAASMDHYFRKYRSAAGILILHDQEGIAITSTNVGVQYAYQLPINKNLTFRPGFQASVVTKRLDYSKLTFGNQYTVDGFTPGSTPDESFPNTIINPYLDLAAGGLLYSQKYWVAIAAHHINNPRQTFYQNNESRLQVKYTVNAGFRFMIPINEFPIVHRTGEKNYRISEARPGVLMVSPAINLKRQGAFDQMDAGVYLNYDPITLGFWYRGLPLKNKSNTINNDALIFLVGMRLREVKIGYSYDLTISKLSTNTGGAHEISAIYDFYLGYRNQKKRKPPRNIRIIPCPKF